MACVTTSHWTSPPDKPHMSQTLLGPPQPLIPRSQHLPGTRAESSPPFALTATLCSVMFLLSFPPLLLSVPALFPSCSPHCNPVFPAPSNSLMPDGLSLKPSTACITLFFQEPLLAAQGACVLWHHQGSCSLPLAGLNFHGIPPLDSPCSLVQMSRGP